MFLWIFQSQNWATFLQGGENKASSAKCCTDYLLENVPSLLKLNQIMFISGVDGDKVVKVTSVNLTDVIELCSNQEEADTRIILHAKYAADNDATTIIVNSPDTDVLILPLHHRAAIRVWQLFFSHRP